MTLWIGLTGGIGSGKSSVATSFSRQGAIIIDTDSIAHQLTAPDGKALPTIRRQFGDIFFDDNGALNRSRFRQLIFNHPSAKQQLESILHPLIFNEVKNQQQSISPVGYGIIEIPLLAEHPIFHQLIQRVLVVTASTAQRIHRVQQRSHLDIALIENIMKQQAQPDILLQLADDVINNDSHKDHLDHEVNRLHHFYQALGNKHHD